MAIKLWPFLCWCWCWCFFKFAACLQNETDRLALISFKEAIQQDPFNLFISWNDSVHFCNWKGVSCSQRHPDRVIALKLNSQRLGGSLSPHIGNLSFLRIIDFQNNSFYGQIPQEIGNLRRIQYIRLSNNSFQGNIPINLSNCSNLMYLNLVDNKLVGNIPAEFGSLSKLETIGLAKNNLTGTIPPSIGNLSSLYQISLVQNGFQGKIPEEISQLGKLRFLIFSDNNLIGEIPRGLFNISSIIIFAMSYNQLNGSIPSDIGLTLPKMNSLQVSGNRFTGTIPNSLSNASALEQIAFSHNYFTGLIPKDLGKLPNLRLIEVRTNQLQDDLSFIVSLTNCSNLKVIGVSTNSLGGSIPISIANLSIQMEVIDRSYNQLHGTIPIGVENLVNLRFFQLENNNLSGPIHISFEKFQQLQFLVLYMNQFTGFIPSSLGNSTMLSRLYLEYNNLTGSIPPSLGNCSNLIDLDLSHNNLSGSIPKEVISLPSISIALDLSVNALSGPIPSEVGLLENLVNLDLSDNRLSGTIPHTIEKCLSLEQLYLEGNLFEGEIPQALDALQGLRVLDISSNNFTGQIPNSLAELDGLNYLNLSFNQLQGEIPKHGIFLNASVVSLLGNNGLCGGITELNLPSCPFPNSKKHNLAVALKVIISVVVCAIFLALLVCFFIFYNRKRISTKKNISISSLEHQFLRISYAELFKATNGFSTDNIIGVGSYGSVYKGFLEQIGTEVAIKVLNLQRKGASNSFMSECQALRTIRHRNLLKLLNVCSSIDFEGNDFKALIYEFMEKGSLEEWLHAHNAGEDGQEREFGNLKLIDRVNIAIDIANAIEYLHNGSSSTIVHGDLKPSNVLLDEEMTAHIGDFGLAKIISTISGEEVQYPSTSIAVKGSIGYVAPEYGMGDSISTEGDIYSYGILLLEMFTGKKPTDDFFKDDLNLHTYVERSFPYKVTDIVDPNTIPFEDGEECVEDCIFCILRIGVACSMEQPGERMKMHDVISELQKIKGSYLNEKLKQEQRNAY